MQKNILSGFELLKKVMIGTVIFTHSYLAIAGDLIVSDVAGKKILKM